MDNNVIETKIRAFFSKHFNTENLSDEDDIFALGFVNSLFAMQLVMFVESDFQLTVENEDLELDNFRTVQALTTFIKSKRKPR